MFVVSWRIKKQWSWHSSHHLNLEHLLVGPALSCQSLHLFHKHLVCCILHIADLISIKRNAVQICIHLRGTRGLCVSRNLNFKARMFAFMQEMPASIGWGTVKQWKHEDSGQRSWSVNFKARLRSSVKKWTLHLPELHFPPSEGNQVMVFDKTASKAGDGNNFAPSSSISSYLSPV